MKKKFYFPIVVAALSLLVSSCSKDDDPVPVPMKVSISTPSDDLYDQNTKMGVYMVNYDDNTQGSLALEGNYADNAEFTYTDNEWNANKDITWKDQTTRASFYCYSPYSLSTSVEAHVFAVKTDQSSEDNYNSSVFWWAKTSGLASLNGVNISPENSVCRIGLNLIPKEGFTDAEFEAATISVIVLNTKPNSTVNLSTGVMTATGEVAEILMRKTPGNESQNIGEFAYAAIVVPQTLSSGGISIKVIIDDVEYDDLIPMSELEANSNMQYEVNIKRK